MYAEEVLVLLDPHNLLISKYCFIQMPPEVKNGKVTLETDQSLPLYGRQKAVLKRQASVIKATQEGDEKKFIFQV